jgi:methyl-accepting chemotaxis protein
MKEMANSVNSTARDIKLITRANRDHAAGTARVVDQLADVRRITDRNAQGVKQTRGGTAELLKQAETLTSIMGEAVASRTSPNGQRRGR